MGDVGRTYELEVRRPREDHLPFVCHLNFTATGGNYGDIIQVWLKKQLCYLKKMSYNDSINRKINRKICTDHTGRSRCPL